MVVKISSNGFTPTQKKMLGILRDGEAHTVEELHSCLMDDLGPPRNIAAHLTAMRGHLKKQGLFIGCQARTYRIYRQISPS